ncbi:MAG: CoA transferase subunit A [Deltaproteobacteria bacterium]|nr:MAG: CoA transferase subunit A [Deltaproteobacteria bacterium]
MDVIEEGVGRLLTDPDPDNAREFFRKKSRKMVDKVMSLKDAIEKFVHDGEYLAIGGFGAIRTPIAACHEIVRQGRKNMGFAGHTSTHDFEVLSAGEVFNRVDIAYIIGLEARGLSPCARRYMESGKVEITEWTNYSLAARLKAAAMGVPFVPTRNVLGTDTFHYSAGKVVECPFTGKKLMLQPALYPDISVIHVHEADIYGNARIKGITISDLDLARASKRLIITTERLISNEEIRRDPSLTSIPFYLVDAVCEVRYGAYPGNMPYEYFSDEEHLQEWLKAERDPEVFKEFLKRNIYDCKNHAEYIELHGGIEKMNELRAKEFLIHKEANNG